MSLSIMLNQLSDPKQKLAITQYERCVVVAGPGSGKTHRLVMKTAYLLGHEIKEPQTIACITYLNDAVREIEDRLSGMGFEEDNRVLIATVHKFCIQAIILPFKNLLLPNYPDEIRIASSEKQLDIVEEILQEYNIPVPSDPRKRYQKLNRTLQEINDERLDQLFERTRNNTEETLSEKYIQKLRENKLVDFKDIEFDACSLVRNNEIVRKYIVSRFPWLVIDEYQDLGQVFNVLVKTLITKTQIKFFIVGDTNQSILGFQGAKPAYLNKLRSVAERDDTAIEFVPISITRRCLPHIVELANRLLPKDTNEIGTIHSKEERREVSVKYCPSGFQSQIVEITKIIRSLNITQGISFGEIAVLCRDRYSISEIAQEFDRVDIQYSGNKDGRYNRTPLTRWLEDLAQWQVADGITKQSKFYKLYKDYRKFARESGMFIFKQLNELEIQTQFFGTIWKSRDSKQLVSKWLKYLTTNLSLDIIVKGIQKIAPYDSEAFWEFSEAVIDDDSLSHMTLGDLALCGRSEKSVFLSTLHSSKGLEFEAVLIPGLEEGRIPDYRAKTEEDIAEERRLLYVGITRAKSEITLLYSGYTTWRTKKFNNGNSRFLKELGLG